MKYFKPLLALLAATLVFLGCQKEYSLENATGTNTSTAQWEFKESGVQYKGPVDSAYIDTVGNIQFLTLEGKSDDGKDQLVLQVFTPDLKPGIFKTPLCSFDYLRNGATLYQSDLSAIDSFTITISKIDITGVTGTFSGQAKDKANASKSIVEGKFTAKFRSSSSGTNPPITDSGQVMLWSKAGCGGGTSTSPIAVSVANKSGQITSFFPAEPGACGTAGAFTAKLAVGNYTWKAVCGTDSISGTVSVSKNGCSKVEVNFSAPPPQGDYFPITANSNWSYLYENSTPDDTLFTVSTGTTKSFGANSYSVFTNTDGVSTDSSFYSKGGGMYYEYYPSNANVFNLDTPTPIQYAFLKDNVAVNTTWDNTISGTIGAVAVQGNIKGTILEKATSVTVNGTTYQDVIKVRLSYIFSVPALPNTEVYRVEEWFARGIGMIKYIDFAGPSDFTIPTDILDITHYQVF